MNVPCAMNVPGPEMAPVVSLVKVEAPVETVTVLPVAAWIVPRGAGVDAKELAAWILEDGLDVRLQLQVHKFIWGADIRGV